MTQKKQHYFLVHLVLTHLFSWGHHNFSVFPTCCACAIMLLLCQHWEWWDHGVVPKAGDEDLVGQLIVDTHLLTQPLLKAWHAKGVKTPIVFGKWSPLFLIEMFYKEKFDLKAKVVFTIDLANCLVWCRKYTEFKFKFVLTYFRRHSPGRGFFVWVRVPGLGQYRHLPGDGGGEVGQLQQPATCPGINQVHSPSYLPRH